MQSSGLEKVEEGRSLKTTFPTVSVASRRSREWWRLGRLWTNVCCFRGSSFFCNIDTGVLRESVLSVIPWPKTSTFHSLYPLWLILTLGLEASGREGGLLLSGGPKIRYWDGGGPQDKIKDCSGREMQGSKAHAEPTPFSLHLISSLQSRDLAPTQKCLYLVFTLSTSFQRCVSSRYHFSVFK